MGIIILNVIKLLCSFVFFQKNTCLFVKFPIVYIVEANSVINENYVYCVSPRYSNSSSTQTQMHTNLQYLKMYDPAPGLEF